MIKFGTSGWRAIIADEFTFGNLRLASHAIADTLLAVGTASRGVAIGYDTRFLSEQFALEAARILATKGIRCVMSATAVPTPVLAHAIRHHGFGGAINITASHNPADYNGLKLSTDKGAPSPPDLTRSVEDRIEALARSADADRLCSPGKIPAEAARLIEKGDFLDAYADHIESLVRFDAIRGARLALGLDPRWGAARGFYDAILRREEIPVTVIHDQRDVTFGGGGPDVSERNLKELSDLVAERRLGLGLACDGDADRFGVVDPEAGWVSPNQLLALLADYLAESRGFRQGVGRTYATTSLLDAVARRHGVPVHQTPVGFKYLGELILQDKVFLAGEESAGMSMTGHVPEKDGILAGLLAAEMVAAKGQSIAKLRQDLFARVGALHSAREDFKVTPEETARLRQAMKAPPGSLGGRAVSRTTVLDGLRLDFDDGAWLLMRPSGTEPVVRYYVEAPTERELGELMRTGKAVLIGGGA